MLAKRPYLLVSGGVDPPSKATTGCPGAGRSRPWPGLTGAASGGWKTALFCHLDSNLIWNGFCDGHRRLVVSQEAGEEDVGKITELTGVSFINKSLPEAGTEMFLPGKAKRSLAMDVEAAPLLCTCLWPTTLLPLLYSACHHAVRLTPTMLTIPIPDMSSSRERNCLVAAGITCAMGVFLLGVLARRLITAFKTK